MKFLPMVPETCSLSEDGVRAQIGRYRTIGEGSRVRQLDEMTLEAVIGREVAEELIEELVATERACCPFFALDWSAGERRLVVGVSKPSDKPALDLIASALGVVR
jgi:hypothetical protein